VSERYDPFGRPIEGDHPWAKPADQDSGSLPGGFLPPEPPPGAPEPAPSTLTTPERPAAATEWPAAAPTGWSAAPVAPRAGPPVETLATWGPRAGAYLVDVLIEGAIGFAIGIVVVAAGAGDTAAGAAIFGTAILVALLYPTTMLATTNGRTVGKKLVGLRVVQAGGAPIGWGRAAMREIVMRVVVIGLIGTLTFGVASLLDVLWPLWDKENRSLHDHGADTWVVRDR
jgi:uncharacterized RDD family membrane protein YckC